MARFPPLKGICLVRSRQQFKLADRSPRGPATEPWLSRLDRPCEHVPSLPSHCALDSLLSATSICFCRHGCRRVVYRAPNPHPPQSPGDWQSSSISFSLRQQPAQAGPRKAVPANTTPCSSRLSPPAFCLGSTRTAVYFRRAGAGKTAFRFRRPGTHRRSRSIYPGPRRSR
jgi:hypothetical protein